MISPLKYSSNAKSLLYYAAFIEFFCLYYLADPFSCIAKILSMFDILADYFSRIKQKAGQHSKVPFSVKANYINAWNSNFFWDVKVLLLDCSPVLLKFIIGHL